VNSLPKTVTRQRRGCDLNPGPSAPESSTLTTWNEMTEDRAVTRDAAPDGVQRVPVDATAARCHHWQRRRPLAATRCLFTQSCPARVYTWPCKKNRNVGQSEHWVRLLLSVTSPRAADLLANRSPRAVFTDALSMGLLTGCEDW